MQRAIKKYGKDSFSKEILFSFDNEEEMNSKEKELVNEEYLKRDDIYNLCPGGQGGFGYINDNPMTNNRKESIIKWNENARSLYMNKLNSNSEFKSEMKIVQQKNMGIAREKIKEMYPNGTFHGKKRTEEWKKNHSNIMKVKQAGSKNSQFGTCWITNGTENKKIKKEDLQLWIELGYNPGKRKMRM